MVQGVVSDPRTRFKPRLEIELGGSRARPEAPRHAETETALVTDPGRPYNEADLGAVGKSDCRLALALWEYDVSGGGRRTCRHPDVAHIVNHDAVLLQGMLVDVQRTNQALRGASAGAAAETCNCRE